MCCGHGNLRGCGGREEPTTNAVKELLNHKFLDADLPYELRVTEAALTEFVRREPLLWARKPSPTPLMLLEPVLTSPAIPTLQAVLPKRGRKALDWTLHHSRFVREDPT